MLLLLVKSVCALDYFKDTEKLLNSTLKYSYTVQMFIATGS